MKSPKVIHPYQDIKTISSPNQCLSWWLVHAYLYYRYDNPIISDKDFDTLTTWLKMSWGQVTHIHKNLITLDDLNAGSGFAVQFPRMVEGSAMHVLREIESSNCGHSTKDKVIKTQAKPSRKTDSTYSEYDSLFT